MKRQFHFRDDYVGLKRKILNVLQIKMNQGFIILVAKVL